MKDDGFYGVLVRDGSAKKYAHSTLYIKHVTVVL